MILFINKNIQISTKYIKLIDLRNFLKKILYINNLFKFVNILKNLNIIFKQIFKKVKNLKINNFFFFLAKKDLIILIWYIFKLFLAIIINNI